MLDIKTIAGIIAGALSLCAFVPYIYSILRGETKPARATWFIWSVVTIMLFVSYKDVGGGTAIWLSLGYVFGVGATALLSIKYGTGGWTILDKVVIAGCIVTIVMWYLTGSALVALVMTMITDLLGGFPTIRHSYYLPQEESSSAWIIGSLANAVNLLAIERWDFTHAAYPVYLLAMVGIITWLVVFRRSKKLK